jgi:toxin ParE1/3/4
MKRRAVVLSPEAQGDLLRLYDWIAGVAGSTVAIRYIDRLEGCCLRLDTASERGRRRDDICAGLRIIGFEKRVTIAFTIEEDNVTILRLFYGGQDWESAL